MSEHASQRTLKGRFITFEGIDGCGKSTQARLMAEWLKEGKRTVLETREPGGTPIGERLRHVLLNPEHEAMTPPCELLLYLADRVQHLEETIRPALARGDVVICDRFHDATVAYQQHGRGLDLSALEGFIREEILATPPDCTFWLDLDVETARRRIVERGRSGQDAMREQDRLDRAEIAFHERVRQGYAALAAEHSGRVIPIDATGDVESIQKEIRARLEERFDVR